MPRKEYQAGEVQLAIRFTPKHNKLTVQILECKNLAKMDILGTSDPYVKIYLMHGKKRLQKQKTSIKWDTLSPFYNESFDFEIAEEKLRDCHLVVTVMDYDRFSRNDFIGKVLIGPNLMKNVQARKQWTEMMNRPGHSALQWHHLENKDLKDNDE